MRPGLALALIFLLSGCLSRPQYSRPPATIPPAFKEPLPEGWKEAQPRDQVAKGKWWTVFEDPILNDLEEKAFAANQGLTMAVARVEQTRAQARFAKADLYPALRTDLGAGGGRAAGNRPVQKSSSTESYNYGLFSIPLDLNYEVDVWGKIRGEVAAARLNVEESTALYQSVLLMLQADVARYYFMVRGIDTDRAVLLRNLDVQRKALDLAKRRHDGGLVSGLDVSQAETLVATTNAEWVGEARLRQELEHYLAALCAQPVTFALAEEYRSRVPPRIPEGLPSDLLERRPDLAAAERELAMNFTKIGVARAVYYPTFSLTGSAGFLSKALTSILDGNSLAILFAPVLSVPIFQGGRPAAAEEYARKVYEESVASYRLKIRVALEEVENGLSDLRVMQAQSAAIDVALKSAQKTLAISQARYEQGLANYLEVLDAQRTILANERQAAQTLGFRMVASVQLIKALGGGWQERGTP